MKNPARIEFLLCGLLLLSGSLHAEEEKVALAPETSEQALVYPPLSRIGIVPPKSAYVIDGPETFGDLNCGKFGWGEPIKLATFNPITWRMVEGGSINQASANPYEESIPVETLKVNGNTLYYSEIPQLDGVGLHMRVAGKVGEIPVDISATIQNLAHSTASKEELKTSLLSVSVRPELTNEQFQKETPLRPKDMAGFVFYKTDEISMYFRDPEWPIEKDTLITDEKRVFQVRADVPEDGEKFSFADFKVGKMGLEDHCTTFKEGAFKVLTHQESKQGGRTWFIFEAAGTKFDGTEEYLACYNGHEPGKPSIYIQLHVPVAEKDALLPRITKFRESLEIVREKMSREE
jgi:hypothetical protein